MSGRGRVICNYKAPARVSLEIIRVRYTDAVDVGRYYCDVICNEENDVIISNGCQRTSEHHGPCRHNPCPSARWDHRWAGWKIWGLKRNITWAIRMSITFCDKSQTHKRARTHARTHTHIVQDVSGSSYLDVSRVFCFWCEATFTGFFFDISMFLSLFCKA